MASERWITIMPAMHQDLVTNDCKMSIVSLPHPKSQKKIKFLLKESTSSCNLFEINQQYDNPSSWLINNEFVKSDGSIMMVTPFDSLFIILSYLCDEKSGKFIILDQLFPKCSGVTNVGSLLFKCLDSKLQMDNIAETAGDNDFAAYRFDEAKTMKWLKKKVEVTATALKKAKLFLEQQENVSIEESRLGYACGMICDYIPNHLADKLKAYLGIKEKTAKRKNIALGPSSKKAKVEPTDDYSKLLPKANNQSDKKSSTRAQKVLDKVDKKGMKTMSSYFKAKPKK